MSTLLDTLTDAGVEVFVDAGQLRYRAPKGAMTSALRAALQEERTELLATLAAVPSALPAGALPLWLWDRLHLLPEVAPAPPPAGMTELEIAAATAEAFAAYEVEVQWQRDHPPTSRSREPWRPNAPCHRCHTFDWYVDDAGTWRCGRCTPPLEAEEVSA